jgi:hypothetical protein
MKVPRARCDNGGGGGSGMFRGHASGGELGSTAYGGGLGPLIPDQDNPRTGPE